MPNEALWIADVSFMVTSQIERAPHWTMIRELTMNAVEAAARASGEKIVHWTTAEVDGVRKAVIYNTGPGMDAGQLKAATDLACTIDKSLGLDRNFGVGAKVSSLGSNRLGLRFRSCKAGRVSEVMLGYDQEAKAYVRFLPRRDDGPFDTVGDVTAQAARAGRDVGIDWTEVLLLGNSRDQDTALRPFAHHHVDPYHVATALYRRFFRLPEGVTIRLDPVYHRREGTQPFIPLGALLGRFPRAETVAVAGSIKIHYLHDPANTDHLENATSVEGTLGTSTSMVCLIHKNEMYSVVTRGEWAAVAPRFGISFGARQIGVHIELDEDGARPSLYRERLIAKESSSDIHLLHYAGLVQDHMPEWLRAIVRNARPNRAEDYGDLQRELQDMLIRYKVPRQHRRPSPRHPPPRETLAASPPDDGKRPPPDPDDMYERAPNIIMLDDDSDVAEKGLRGRAAKFITETGDLFVNGLYEAVDRTADLVAPELADVGADRDEVRAALLRAARRALALRVGKAAVFALAKRGRDHWDEHAMGAALSRESLSMAADNYGESVAFVALRVREEFGVAGR